MGLFEMIFPTPLIKQMNNVAKVGQPEMKRIVNQVQKHASMSSLESLTGLEDSMDKLELSLKSSTYTKQCHIHSDANQFTK
jgi:hypothetical protein